MTATPNPRVQMSSAHSDVGALATSVRCSCMPPETPGGASPPVAVDVVRAHALIDRSKLVVDGGLLSYSTDFIEQHRRAASYVDRLLRGVKIADLPVQWPTKYQLVVNVKTAKAIGLTIPEAFLLQADELIE